MRKGLLLRGLGGPVTPGRGAGRLPGESCPDWVEEEEGGAASLAGRPRRRGTDVQVGPLDPQGLAVTSRVVTRYGARNRPEGAAFPGVRWANKGSAGASGLGVRVTVL